MMDYHEKNNTNAYYEAVGPKMIPKTLHYSSLKSTFSEIDKTIKRIICMSDLHGATSEIIRDLIKKKRISGNTLVLCMGDMGGSGKYGGKHDPTDDYREILKTAKGLYFVQGNHDIHSEEALKLKNTDGTNCCVHNTVIETPIGLLGGVNGIISTRSEPNKDMHIYEKDEYGVGFY